MALHTERERERETYTHSLTHVYVFCREMQADLQTLQQEKEMVEGALSFNDNEKGMAYIQSGKCVLVEGEQAQQFRFKVWLYVCLYVVCMCVCAHMYVCSERQMCTCGGRAGANSSDSRCG